MNQRSLISMYRIVRMPAVVVALCASLVACTDSPSVVQVGEEGETNFTITAPTMFNTRAVVTENLNVTVRLNDRTVLMSNNNGQWTGNTNVPESSSVNLEINWYEAIGTRNLHLAKYSRAFENVNQNLALTIVSEDYDIAIDDDNDSHYNLIERRENTDPYDANSPSAGFSTVLITAVDPQNAPIIDGAYDANKWGNAQFVDKDGRRLYINHLMIDQGAAQANEEPLYQWAAMHDEKYLYLFVFGEAGQYQTPHKDSENSFNDDSLEIFFDGNNSKLLSYDGVDDIHIIIPLMTDGATRRANNSANADAIVELGDRSAPFDLSKIDFATCVCLGDRYTWEVRIELEEAQVPISEVFGFEVQLNDDNDGDARDVKWGWFHPARVNVDTDQTWRFPVVMGNVNLEPLPDI